MTLVSEMPKPFDLVAPVSNCPYSAHTAIRSTVDDAGSPIPMVRPAVLAAAATRARRGASSLGRVRALIPTGFGMNHEVLRREESIEAEVPICQPLRTEWAFVLPVGIHESESIGTEPSKVAPAAGIG